jgi:protein O-mannosyl-transferase
VTNLENNKSAIQKSVLVLCVVSLCIYANTLQNGFAFDDYMVIKRNELVKDGIAAIPAILSSPYYNGDMKELRRSKAEDLYRPLSTVMFAVEYQLFPDNPFPGHLVNILLYAGCVILFFLFLYHLFRRQKPFLSLVAALLFALHPVHTEVVANIKSRDELLCFFFSFLSLNLFLRFFDSDNKRLLVAGLFCYFLSLLSKETSVVFLAVIPLIFFVFRNENKKRSTRIFFFSLAVVVAWLALRSFILTSHHTFEPADVQFADNPLAGAPSVTSRIATEIMILGYYIKLLVVPFPLICDYGYRTIPFTGFGNILVWLSLILYMLLVFFGIYRVIKKRNDPLAFGILFFLIAISLFSNILFLLASEMAERFLFFPSAGFCLVVAFAIERSLFKIELVGMGEIKNRKVLLVLIPVTLVCAALVIQRNREWKDNFTLFRADVRKAPENFRLHYFVADEEIALANNEATDPSVKRQLFEEAIKEYQKYLVAYPDFSKALTHIGNAFVSMKQLDSAEVYFKKAMMNNYSDTDAFIQLANTYAASHKYAEAMKILKQVSAVNPSSPYYLFNIAVCNLYTRQYDSAIYYLQKTLEKDPGYDRALKFIAVVYNTTGQKDSAKKYEAIVKRTIPGFSVDKVALPN